MTNLSHRLRIESQFVKLMSELFQLDEAEALDFGIYRVIRHHNREVRAFLGSVVKSSPDTSTLQGGRLAALLDEAFRKADHEAAAQDAARVKALEGQLGITPGMARAERTRLLEILAAIPATTGVVDEYRGLLEQRAGGDNAEHDRIEVLNRLYQFFERHYQDGDFIVERRYGRNGARYIRSTGEDTEFHWATEDMYYVKSGDIYTDYPVRLANGQRLVFSVEPESLQATRALLKPNDKAHYALHGVHPHDSHLQVQLQYLKGTQTDRQREEIVSAVHARTGGEPADIKRWLARFIARNQNDFFIHKRLNDALYEDLDIFIKTEVLDAEQLLADQTLSLRTLKVGRIVREVGRQIIGFLAALEDFQKALWEKKKLVLQTRYVITLDRLARHAPDWLASQIDTIVAGQRQEWLALGLGDIPDAAACRQETPGDLASPARVRYLPLPVDTGNFSDAFKWAMLDAISAVVDLDKALDGVAIRSDNWQALNTLQARYWEQVKCVYIDPPYNTGGDGFPYKDAYRHASWMAMMDNRLETGLALMAMDAAMFVSLDDNEHSAFRQLADRRLGAGNFVANLIWQKNFSPKNSARHFSEDHDHIFVFARNAARWSPYLLPRTAEMEARYSNPDGDKRGAWTSGDLAARNPYSEGIYPIACPSGRTIPGPPPGTFWRVSKTKFDELDKDGRVWWGADRNNVPRLKRFLSEVKQGRVPQTIWPYEEVGHTQDAKKELLAYTNLSADESVFNTPKPTELIKQVLKLATDANGNGEWVADFFAGSGTTGHAVLAQNQEDRAGRRFLLVECNTYFDKLLVPRLKRAAAIPDYKKPRTLDGDGAFFRVQTLEQYEDTLENLALPADETAGDDLFDDATFALRYRLDRTSRRAYCDITHFSTPFGYSLKRVEGGGEAPAAAVDLVESLVYLLGLAVQRLFRTSQGVVVTGSNQRRQSVAVFFRDCAAAGSDDWVASMLATHPADRAYANAVAELSFPGCDRLESIEAVFAGQFGSI